MKGKAAYWYVEIVAALFVLLFTYTAIDKLRHYTGFARAMLHSPLIAHYAQFLAIAVPAVEVMSVALLLVPATRWWGLVLATTTMLLFTFYIGFMLARSSKLPCTCAGVFERLTWRQHLLFNMSFLLMGSSALWRYHKDLFMISRRSRLPV